MILKELTEAKRERIRHAGQHISPAVSDILPITVIANFTNKWYRATRFFEPVPKWGHIHLNERHPGKIMAVPSDRIIEEAKKEKRKKVIFQNLRKKALPLKPGRFLQSIYPQVSQVDLETFIYNVRAIFAWELWDFDYRFLEGPEVLDAYDHNKIAKKGSIKSSCMNGHFNLIDFYNAPNIKILVVTESGEEEIIGRAVLWENVEVVYPEEEKGTITYLDRRYTTREDVNRFIETLAKKNGWWYRAENTLDSKGIIDSKGVYSYPLLRFVYLNTPPDDDENFPIPYLDTFHWGRFEILGKEPKLVLYSRRPSNKEHFYNLQSTNGGPFHSSLECNECGTTIEPGDAITGPDDSVYCMNCYCKLFTSCTNCGRVVTIEEAIHGDAEYFCSPSCAREYGYDVCDACGRLTIDPIITQDESVFCSKDCLKAEGYHECEACGEYAYSTFKTRSGEHYCSTLCYRKHGLDLCRGCGYLVENPPFSIHPHVFCSERCLEIAGFKYCPDCQEIYDINQPHICQRRLFS